MAMTKGLASSLANAAPAGVRDRNGADQGLDDRRTLSRVPVEGAVRIWRAGESSPQPARMHDISGGGALLETEPLTLGEDIRVEIEGDFGTFTMDAVVIRICPRRGVNGFGVRFVDREHRSYAEWLHQEWIRLSMWQCRDNDPLVATGNALTAMSQNDPAYIPVHPVLQMIRYQPGTCLADLLGLESFDRMYIRIAVARLIESRALAVMKTDEGRAHPSPGIMARVWESLLSTKLKGVAVPDPLRGPLPRTGGS
jgi:hypothetical protein